MSLKYLQGKDGFLFLDNDSNEVIRQVSGDIDFTIDKAEQIYKFNRDVFRASLSVGRRFLHIIAPNKETSLRDYLPDDIKYESYGPTPLSTYYQYFPRASEFTFFDADFLKPDGREVVAYPRGDTHWDAVAARNYFMHACKALGADDVARDIADVNVRETTVLAQGDLNVHAGLGKDYVRSIEVIDGSAQVRFSGNIINEGYVRHYVGGHGTKKVLFLHDSFVHVMYDFLAESFREVLFIHCPNYTPDIVENFAPDVIIKLQAERFFPRLPDVLSSSFKWLRDIERKKNVGRASSSYLVNFCREKESLYQIVSIADIPGIPRSDGLAPAKVAIRPIEFGQMQRPTEFPTQDYPLGEWMLSDYEVNDGSVYEIADAVVHGEAGIVTCGRKLIRESLYLAFEEAWGMERLDNDLMYIPPFAIDINILEAAHVLCGGVGSRNYGHWWANVIPALRIRPFYGEFEDAVLLMPALTKSWQRSTLELVPEVRGKAIFLGEQTKVHCDTLKFAPRLLAADYTPHPDRVKMFGEFRRRADDGVQRPERIFVSRADSNIRVLENEEELISIAKEFGFEALTLSGKSVKDQINIFSKAKYIISPHGAGLCNVSFCHPSTTLLELHKNTTVQWSIRRSCSPVGLRYGCLIGLDNPSQTRANVHDYTWRLSAEAFRACLEGEVAAGVLTRV